MGPVVVLAVLCPFPVQVFFWSVGWGWLMEGALEGGVGGEEG